MKKRFTRILAALALLVGLTIPLGMWGQTTATINSFSAISGNIDSNISYAAAQGNGTTAPVISGTWLRIYKPASGQSTGGLVTITAATGYQMTSVTITNANDKAGTIKYSVDGGSLSNSISLAKEASYTVDNITASAVTFYNCGGDRLSIAGFSVVYTGGGGTPTCATPSFNPASGAVFSGTTVSISSTEGATIYYTTNGTTPTTNSSTYSNPIEITGTTTIKAFATKDGYNASEIATAEYTIKTPVTGYNIDFESDLDCYVDWEFTNVSRRNGITAHNGSYYASNINESGNATTTAIFQTKAKVTYPDKLTCYLSKEGNNTNANSNWYVQVSSNGEDWEDISNHAAAVGITSGEWTEFSGDIKAAGHTNVFVRLYYSGSNAIRAVDDISLTTYTPVAVEMPAINVPEEFTISTTATITCVTQGATIYYSFDNETWNEYTEALTITETKTIYAKAVKGTDESEVAQATTTKVLAVPTVTISSTSINIGETATVSVEETGAPAITLTTSDATVATVSEMTVTGVAAGTVTITATWSENNDYSAGSIDFTVVVSDPNAPGSANNPYTVAQAIAFIDDLNGATSEVVYVSGIISQVDEYFNNYHSITYWISDDGTTETQLEVYSGKGLNGANFSSIDDLQVNDIVTVKGNLKLYGEVYEFNYNSQITQFERPQSTEPSITVTPETVNLTSEQTGAFLTVAYENLAAEPDFDVLFVDANGDEAEYDWLGIAYDNIESIELQAQANDGEARTAYVMVIGYDNEANMVQSNIVTVNQAAYVAPFAPTLYEKVTSTLDDFSGQYIIVGFNDNDAYAMAEQKANNRNAFIISEDGTYATVISDAVHELTIAKQGDYYTIYDGREGENNNKGYLYAAGGNGNNPKNYLKTETDLDENNNGLWAIGIDNEGNTSIVSQGNASRTIMRFNYNSGSPLFSCYGSGQQPVFLYKKSNEAPVNYTLTINGYTDDNSKAGYYLIASPVKVNPATTGMTTGDFDLYYFDQVGDSEGKEWINYEAGAFNLVPGKGYLYAKKATSQDPYSFTLTGVPYDGDGEIELTNTTGADFAGWNLVGNPFGEEAEISMDYYELNPTDTELIAGTDYVIDAMQGVFVKYSSTNTTVMFAPSDVVTPSHSNDANVVLNVTRNRGNVIDRAIVRFGEGDQLPKFQLNPNSTKIYVTEGNKDYAVVRSAAEAEMPVSFRASENGTYTLAVEAENVEMNYLHLIDNLTGMDVDLLQTPSYTFQAKTTDYASRFKLVFAIDRTNDESFAFFNNDNWFINNDGKALLQVIDLNGRLLSNEQISGSVSKHIDAAPGVYVIRLINGDNVKTQKVVVR